MFFFNDTATTEIYTLSLHDALPIWLLAEAKRETGMPIITEVMDARDLDAVLEVADVIQLGARNMQDRKSTRLNSSHANISYAVFCLKKKKKTYTCTHNT